MGTRTLLQYHLTCTEGYTPHPEWILVLCCRVPSTSEPEMGPEWASHFNQIQFQTWFFKSCFVKTQETDKNNSFIMSEDIKAFTKCQGKPFHLNRNSHYVPRKNALFQTVFIVVSQYPSYLLCLGTLHISHFLGCLCFTSVLLRGEVCMHKTRLESLSVMFSEYCW
jgi:hypothetical protein